MLVLLGLMLSGLAGCTSSSLDVPALNKASAGAPATAAALPEHVVFKPVAGPPETITRQLALQLNQAATKRNIALLVDADAKARRTLQGNVWLRPDASGTKLVYVWDVIGDDGVRFNRMRGEEPLGAVQTAGDPWSAVTLAQIGLVAEKAISSLSDPAAK